MTRAVSELSDCDNFILCRTNSIGTAIAEAIYVWSRVAFVVFDFSINLECETQVQVLRFPWHRPHGEDEPANGKTVKVGELKSVEFRGFTISTYLLVLNSRWLRSRCFSELRAMFAAVIVMLLRWNDKDVYPLNTKYSSTETYRVLMAQKVLHHWNDYTTPKNS
jgi:hypothetical protein